MNQLMTVTAWLLIIKSNRRMLSVETFGGFLPSPVLPSTSTTGAILDKSPSFHRSSGDMCVSPSVIIPIPKATPKKGSSRIMDDTPIRNTVATALDQSQAKKGKAIRPSPKKFLS